jgi:hypothetical protein
MGLRHKAVAPFRLSLFSGIFWRSRGEKSTISFKIRVMLFGLNDSAR